MLIGAVTVKNNMEVSQKLKIELPYDSAIPLLGGICLSEINKNTNAKRHTHSKVQSSIIYNCQGMEAT